MSQNNRQAAAAASVLETIEDGIIIMSSAIARNIIESCSTLLRVYIGLQSSVKLHARTNQNVIYNSNQLSY